MHFWNGLRRHIAFGESSLHERDRKNRVTPAAHVVHVCARSSSVSIASHHAFLQAREQFFILKLPLPQVCCECGTSRKRERVHLPECLNNHIRGGLTGLVHKAPFSDVLALGENESVTGPISRDPSLFHYVSPGTILRFCMTLRSLYQLPFWQTASYKSLVSTLEPPEIENDKIIRC